MIGLCSDFHSLRETLCTSRKEHEFLECEFVPGMGATVDYIEGRAREDIGRLDARKLGEMLVERNAFLRSTSLGNGNGNAEDGIGTQFPLVRCAVKLDEPIINVLLLSDFQATFDELRADNFVDVLDSFRHPWTCRFTDYQISSQNQDKRSYPFRGIHSCSRHEARRPRGHP